jgi:hypothetical protein
MSHDATPLRPHHGGRYNWVETWNSVDKNVKQYPADPARRSSGNSNGIITKSIMLEIVEKTVDFF